MRRWSTAVAACVVIACGALLAGCPVPIPPLGYGDTRGNVPDRKPAFIVEGRTTRAEVLLQLGTPDDAGDDESWIVYRNRRHKGGVAFVAGAGGAFGGVAVQSFLERRLVVHFDDSGTVARMDFDEKECQQVAIEPGGSPPGQTPCLEPRPAAEPAIAGTVADAPGGDLATVDAPVVGSCDDVMWALLSASAQPTALMGVVSYRGRAVVTESSLRVSGTRILSQQTKSVRIAFGDVRRVARGSFLASPMLLVTTADGTRLRVQCLKWGAIGMSDDERSDALTALVAKLSNLPVEPF